MTLPRSRMVLMVSTPPSWRFHGVDGVVDDVEEHLHQLIAVAAHAGKNGFQLQFNSRFRGRKSRERSCMALVTTVLMSRSVRSGGTWRAKLSRLPTSVLVRRA